MSSVRNREEEKPWLPDLGAAGCMFHKLFRALTTARRAARYLFITITLLPLSHGHLRAQRITTQALPGQTLPEVPNAEEERHLPNAPDPSAYPGTLGYPGAPAYPDATPVLAPESDQSPIIEADTQSFHGGIYTLDGKVVITSKDRRVEADHIEYDSNTGEMTATGHVLVLGGVNDERIAASHGNFNLRTATGNFYDVSGSVGLRPSPGSRPTLYRNENPFLFTGRMVSKKGPRSYDVFDGTVTSCLLPTPDWLLSAGRFSVTDEKATARNSTFRLLNLPILFLPYVTHPLDQEARQTGFLIPSAGYSSTRGFSVGDEIYFAINRSTDLLVGAEYYSLRGFSQLATFRYRGANLDFVTAHYTGLLDRLPAALNQGGEDLTFAGRHDFSPRTRVAANVEYLSSYIYREAFSDNFNQAVTSDIVSTAYASHHRNGIEIGALADRYQGIKFVGFGSNPQQQVRIFHVPTLSLASTEHRLQGTGLQLSLGASASGLKRSQPNFATGGIVERFDLHPEAAYPFSLGAWRVRPAVAVRETLYSRSLAPRQAGQRPTEALAGLSRSDFEFALDLRAPVLTRTFRPTVLPAILGSELRHTIEPELTYRLATGISNFAQVLRFDVTDVASNTHEVEYGVTQRLFRRTAGVKPCSNAASFLPGLNPDPRSDSSNPAPLPGSLCNDGEVFSWRLAQKYFFDPTFGGAVRRSRRNIFETTLNFSGTAFLTEPREISPLISRLRLRSSAHTDVEWDFDFDTGAKHFTSSNVFVDVHQGNAFTAISYARLDAPGRSFSQQVTPTSTIGFNSLVSDFNQLRFLLGYGSPAKPGLSLATNLGLDLKSFSGTANAESTNGNTPGATSTFYPSLFQYTAVQTAYNWNCCGVAFKYSRFQLGSVRNDPGFRFSFSLANVASFGNLRRTERLF